MATTITTEECVRIVRWYGYDVTFHYRPDGRVDALTSYIGVHPIAHLYESEEDAVRLTLDMVAGIVKNTISGIEMERAFDELQKNTIYDFL